MALNSLKEQIRTVEQMSEQESLNLPVTQLILQKCGMFRTQFPGNQRTPEILYLAATIRFNAGAYEDALKDYSTVINEYPQAPCENLKSMTEI